MPSKDRKMVNVKPIHDRLMVERERLERAHDRGDIVLPDFGHDQGIPLWYVIQWLLEHRDRHRTRQARYRQTLKQRKQHHDQPQRHPIAASNSHDDEKANAA